MNVYVWHRLNKVSTNYHEGGGVVVVAESLESARELFVAEAENDVKDSDILTAIPDYMYPIVGSDWPARVIVFPDAGCC